MTPKELDNILRSALLSHKIPVDANEMWTGVQKKMNRRKKRKGILFLLLGIGIVMLSILSGVWDRPASQTATQVNPFLKTDESLSALSSGEVGLFSAPQSNNNQVKQSSDAQKHLSIENRSVAKLPAKPRNSTVFKPNLVNRDPHKTKTVKNTFTATLSPKSQRSIRLDEPIHPLLKSLPSIPLLDIALTFTTGVLKKIKLPAISFKEAISPSFKEDLSLGFFFSYGKHRQWFKPVSENRNQFYQSTRPISEIPLENLKAGLSIKKNLRGHFFISSGLSLYRRTDIYSDTIKTVVNTKISKSYAPVINGEVKAIYPVSISHYSKQQKTTIYKVYNNYSGFQLPLLIGYSLAFGKNSFAISLGTGLNYRTKVKGYTTFEYNAYHLSTFESNDVLVYPDMFYLTGLGKIHYEHQYSPHTSAYLGISAEQSLGNILASSSQLNHQFRSVQLEGGFYYRLH